MTSELLITFIIAGAVIVAVPGPNIMLIVADSINHGFRDSLKTILGVTAGTFLLVLLSMAGVATLLTMFSGVFTILKWIGAGYLAYVGISQIRGSFRSEDAGGTQKADHGSLFVRGFLVAATNPKGLLFAGAFFPQFISKEAPLIPQLLILCGTFLLVSVIIEVVYAYLGDRSGRLFKTPTFRNIAARVSGTVLVLFGIGLLFAKNDG